MTCSILMFPMSIVNSSDICGAVNITVPCMNGQQHWQGLYYPGVITPHPTGTEDYSIRGKFRVPVNFHIGNMILAAATNYSVDSVPPSKFGGELSVCLREKSPFPQT